MSLGAWSLFGRKLDRRLRGRGQRREAGGLCKRNRSLRLEPLEERRLLASELSSMPQTLDDLPTAAKAAVSASIGRDLSGYLATAAVGGRTSENPANHLVPALAIPAFASRRATTSGR